MKRLYNNFFPPQVFTYTSDRSVNYAMKPSDHDFTEDQKEAFQSALNMENGHVFNIRQVHGDRIVFASKENIIDADEIEEADGILTDEIDLSIAVRTADCLPVFIYDPDHAAIGVFHCGWQSTQKHILKKALELMKKYYQTKPASLQVAFGPALRNCHFEVGKEFEEYFPGEIEERDGKKFFDIIRSNKNQLIEGGVKKRNIHDSQVCTICDSSCFSYREEGEGSGRMLSVMMIKTE